MYRKQRCCCWLIIAALSFSCLALRVESAQSADQEALRKLVNELFAAYARKDLQAFLSLWSAKSPELESRKIAMPDLFAEHEKLEVKDLSIGEVSVEGERATVHYEVDLGAAEIGTRRHATGSGKSTRKLYGINEDGTWRVWRDASLEEDLALKLIDAQSEQERIALLSSESQLVTTKLRKALVVQAERQSYLANHSAALAIYAIARAIAERIGDKEGMADVSLGLGMIHRSQGNFNAALEDLEKCSTLYREVGNQEYLAFALDSIGTVHRKLGNYVLALEYSEKSLAIAEASGSRDASLSTLMNLGNVWYALGDFPRALEAYQKVLPIFEALNRRQGISYALSNIGNIYYVQGNYGGALELYQKSLAIEQSIGDQSGISSSLASIGFVHRQQGNYDLALEFYQKSLALRQTLGAKADIANSLNYIGNVHKLRGEQGQALDFFRKSLELKEALGDKPGAASSLFGIGQFYQSEGNYGMALDSYRKSLKLFEAMGSRHWISTVQLGIAQTHYSRGSYKEARESAERAADIAMQTGMVEALWEARTIMGKIHLALSQPAQARRAFEEAISAIEELRGQLAGDEQSQQHFFESKVAPYHEMIGLLVAQGNLEEALAYAERAKARVLLDVLNTGRVNFSKAMNSQEQEQEQKLKTKLASLNLQISRESQLAQTDPKRLTDIHDRRQKARLEYEAFQTSLYATHPELKVRRGEAQPVKLEDAAALLPDRQGALLEYVVTNEKTYLFVLSYAAAETLQRQATGAIAQPLRLRVYSLEVKRKDLAAQAIEFRRQLAKRNLGFRETARSLYDLLLKPARAELQGKRTLVIVPDGALWELPFQALQDAKGRYLLEDHVLSYAPSLTVLREMARLRTKRPGDRPTFATLLAMGNPALGKQTIDRVTLAHRDEQLEPLPEAEKEVKTLAQLYGSAQSRVYVGVEAREERMKNEAGSFAIVHLATHSTLDDASPMYSRVLLSQEAGNANEDGLLEAWEIMKLDLKADIVVLSACETARGRVAAGEGVIGLTWALFIAGTPTTVVSQWKVESASTTELMVEFHGNLRSHFKPGGQQLGPALALREAALKLLKNRRYSHPFYWAGFVVVGVGS
ncbi:MAG TPA: CHAT domain-containing tetratricopeptide repeat protein [Blastocatellia bacterium]|nr:CHAT domain-containing tetratricopeptide repeat protein [Blastocatellia bacterium]